jgi:hypothetical protein
MPNFASVKYIGTTAYTDLDAGTGSWAVGEVRTVDDIDATVLCRRNDKFAFVVNADAKYSTDSTGKAVGLIDPKTGGTMNLTAASLVASYEAMQQENQLRGHYLEPRAGLTVADTPTLSGNATIPSSDATDPATQRISLFGSDLTGVTSLSKTQLDLGKRWLRGFSSGANGFGESSCYRLSSSMGVYNTAGNQNLRASDNYGYDAGVWYCEVYVISDVYYFRAQSGSRWSLWVNDNLISNTATLGANITYSATTQDFTAATAGHGYIKVKFSAVARRKIKIAMWGGSSFGDIWTRAVGTITPAYINPIEWVHFGDSFSQYTGATTAIRSLTDYMAYAFGRNINFINVSQGSTSFTNAAQNHVGVAPINGQKASFHQQYVGNWKNNNPKIITGLVGHNDVNNSQSLISSRLIEMLTQVRSDNPSAIIIIFTCNTSLSAIASGNDALTEINIINTINSLGLGIYTVPMQSNLNVYGALVRGTGRVGATTGVGNSDTWIASDGGHPSDTGHKEGGIWMAERMYEILKANMLN